MDDQQARLYAWKHWLAAFVDSEGCVLLYKSNSVARRYPFYRITPLIHIVNQDLAMINQAAHILRILDIGFLVITKTKGLHMIWISGFKRVYKFLDIFYDLLVSKRDEAKVVLDFIKSRWSKTKFDDYTTEEMNMLDQCKYLKHHRSLRDYTPTLPDFNGKDDIVRTNWKPVRNGRNDHSLRLKAELIK